MAQFNLADYETVEERIKRLYDLHPDARIITKNKTKPSDRQMATWVVKAEIWLPNPFFSPENWAETYILKATGWAFEVDGSGMATKTSGLEVCETSAIGRALANMNLSGNKRASREEMAKVERGVVPLDVWLAKADKLVLADDLPGLRELYGQAERVGASSDILKGITDRANGLKVAQNLAG